MSDQIETPTMTDAEFLEALAAKCEQETQVWLGFKNTERAARLRAIIASLEDVRGYTERYIDSDDLPYAVGIMNSIILEYESQRNEQA